MQAQAQKNQAEYNAAVERNNVIIAEQNAEAILQQGTVQKDLHREKIAQTIATSKVNAAAQGLIVDEEGGVVGDLIDDLRLAGALDIMTIRHNVGLEERRANIERDQFVAKADLFDMQADSINPAFAGVTGLIGGLSSSGLFEKG